MTEWIITSCVLILVVIILRTVLKGKISLRLQYALWALVLVRLLIPGSLFSSAVSVMNAVGERPSVPTEITVADPPGRWEYPGVELAPTITQTVDEQGNVHYTEDLEKWEQDKEAAWQEYKEEHTEYVTLPVADILRTVWYAGMAVMALWLVIGNLRFRLRITRSREVIKFAPPAVYVTEDIETPCLFGLFQPAVYVTPDVAEDKTALSHVLAHEETHYHHKDHIWALLRCVCLVLHWYNPLVWLAAALSRRDSELACDEGAIRRLGEEQRAAYGRTLIGLTCTGVGGLLRTATTMTGSKKSIKERIVLIAKKPKMKLYTLIAVILIAVIAAGCTFTGQSMDFPGWVATITVEDLDSGSTGEGDGGASLEGPGTYRVMTIQEREELLTILQGIGKSDFVTRDPGLTEYGYSVSIHGPYNGEAKSNGWWRFTCLSDGMLKVECRDSMIAAKYGFREVQYLNCPALYSFIIEHAETYDPFTEQTDSQEEQLERLAQRMMEEHAETVTKELSHYFAPGEVQNVIPWRTGALKGSDFRLDVVKVEFYLLREEREGTGGDILRGDPVGYTRYLFLLYQGDSVILLGHMDDTTISNVYGTPEMTDVSGDAFKAAAAELYKAYKAAQPVTPEGLLEAYARDVAEAHAAELTSRSDHTVVVDRINGLTPWRSEIAGGSGSHVDVVKVDYVLDHQRQGAAGPSSVISTYESVYRYLFLLYQGDSVTLLGHMDDTTVSNVYGTPEMTDRYGDAYTAAAMELYSSFCNRENVMNALQRMESLTADDIDLISSDGWAVVTAWQLADALNGAANREVQQADDFNSWYSLTLYLSEVHSSQSEHFYLCAGLEEDLVQVMYRNTRNESEKRYFKDSTLYRLIRNCYRTDLNLGKEFNRYQSILEARAQTTVDTVPNMQGECAYTGYDICEFTYADTFKTAEYTYTLYHWNVAFHTDDIDSVIWCGGMTLDAEGRVRGVEENTYFAVREGASGKEDYCFLSWQLYFGSDEQTRRDNALHSIESAFAAAAEQSGSYLLDRAFNVALLAEPNAEETARYDLNGDGWDELIVKSGTCEADLEYVFYAYRNGVQGAEPIGRVDGGHSYLAVADDGALVVAGGHMGGEWAWRVTWDDDGFHSSLLYERDVGTGAYTNWPKRLQTVTVSGGAAVVPLPAGPVGRSGVGLTVEGESAKAAAEGFFMAYARAELLSNGGVADYKVMYNELMEISTDGTAVIGRFACSVLLYDGTELAPDNGWQARGGDYEGWYYTCPYFLLEKQADGRWLCTRWSTDDKGLYLSDFGYENGLWGAIYGNPKTYRCKETDPQKAAETLIAAYVEDLTKPDELRSFTITEYRNLTVFVVPTLEMSEADRSNYNYGLKDSEIGENHWIVEFGMEYRWTGMLHNPPAGPGGYLPEGTWFDQVGQGSPVGFLLTRDGDEFVLRSRYPDRY